MVNTNKIHEKYEEIFNKYWKLVYVVISKYVKNIDDITDLTYQVFLNFFNIYIKRPIIGNIKSYLTTSARNIAFDFIKKHNIIYIEDLDLIVEEENTNIPYIYIYSQRTSQISFTKRNRYNYTSCSRMH